MAREGERTQSQELETNASLLEDASTLLMFHSAAVESHKSPSETQHQKSLPAAEQGTGTTVQGSTSSPIEQPSVVIMPSTSASAAAAPADSTNTEQVGNLLPHTEIKTSPSPTAVQPVLVSSSSTAVTSHSTVRRGHITSPGPAIATLSEQDSKTNKSQKAIVAAAALAAAAGIPLPLANRSGSVDRALRATIEEKSETESEAINETVKEQLSKDHIDALREQTAQVRKEVPSKQKSEDTDTEEQSSEPNKLDAMDIDENATTADEKEFNETEAEREEEPHSRPKRRKRNTTPQPSKDWVVDPDAGIITCVCGYDEDDGFTIQCDNCNRWQHAICMGIEDINDAPEKYLCYKCEPKQIDQKRARAIQGKRLAELKKKKNKQTTDDGSVVEKSSDSTKEEKTSKPKPKPVTAYNKNLDESDIATPPAKDLPDALYYKLENYDYQDNDAYRYIQSLLTKEDNGFAFIKGSKLENYHFPRTIVKPYSEVNNKKFNGIVKLGFFTENDIQEGDYVSEYLGEVGLKEKYISDSRNHYRIWGVEKGYVSFVPNTKLVVDARSSGNEARFIRRSCHPNCELRVVQTESSLNFLIVAVKPIKAGTELTLPWNWDSMHPILSILEGNTFDSIADTEKPCLVLSVESVLTFIECACPTNGSDCALSKVKKASAHIYRSTRKGNSTSGLKLLQPEAKYVSIDERLAKMEMSNIRQAKAQLEATPLISTPETSSEPQVSARPYIYHYLTKRPRTLPSPPEIEKTEYLPVPIPLVQAQVPEEKKSILPAKPVKKLSFADYKKKMKPTS